MMGFDMALTLALHTSELVFYLAGILALIKYLRKK